LVGISNSSAISLGIPELLDHVLVRIVGLLAEHLLDKALDSLLQLMPVEVIPRHTHSIVRLLLHFVSDDRCFPPADAKL
jgi:hypothetical protein